MDLGIEPGGAEQKGGDSPVGHESLMSMKTETWVGCDGKSSKDFCPRMDLKKSSYYFGLTGTNISDYHISTIPYRTGLNRMFASLSEPPE